MYVTVTILYAGTFNTGTTLTVTQTASNPPSEQSLQSAESCTVWMAVAAVFLLMIALSSIVLNIIMGHTLHKKTKIMKTASAADSNGKSIELVKQGKVSCSQSSNYV